VNKISKSSLNVIHLVLILVGAFNLIYMFYLFMIIYSVDLLFGFYRQNYILLSNVYLNELILLSFSGSLFLSLGLLLSYYLSKI